MDFLVLWERVIFIEIYIRLVLVRKGNLKDGFELVGFRIIEPKNNENENGKSIDSLYGDDGDDDDNDDNDDDDDDNDPFAKLFAESEENM